MAPLTDPDRLRAYKDALANWKYGGRGRSYSARDSFIQFELTETAYKWVRLELDDMEHREIGRLMHEFVQARGKIDEVPETRPEWSEHDYHYDLRFTIQDQPVYIETRLNYELPFKPDQSTIVVVNIHAP